MLLTNERSGFHLYLPCPSCLHTHGKRELDDPKYAINVSKYLEQGKFREEAPASPGRRHDPFALIERDERRRARDEKSGICMRTRQSQAPHRHSVHELLNMGTIPQRHPDLRSRAEVRGQAGSGDREAFWLPDATTGVPCPPPPGRTVPITSLPPGHPAVEYLTGRGYSLRKLEEQFGCSWCEEEFPEGAKHDIFYRKMPGGWRDTPQHRVIFNAYIGGRTPLTWQARYPEKLSPDGLNKFMLHPYDVPYTWSHVATRPNVQAAWIPVPPFNETDAAGLLKFKPSKYRTAKHSSRELMGWDAAIARANGDTDAVKWCVLCEGPLDAARVGPGGMAVIGASLRPDQAARIAGAFHVVFTAFDADRAGRNSGHGHKVLMLHLLENRPVGIAFFLPGASDGSMSLLLPTPERRTINRKPVLYRDAASVLTIPQLPFHHKQLCDGITLNLGDACGYSCEFCYCESVIYKLVKPLIVEYNSEHGTNLGFADFVIRRRHSLELLREQLLNDHGAPIYNDPSDTRVVYSSTLVDVAANMELLRETADACNLILKNTPWQIRLLSKSNLLHKLVADRMIPEEYHQRLIFGFSTGTLDDRVAKAIETGTPLVSQRLKSLHWLQDRGFRTFGMLCPSLPQENYDTFSRELCEAIRADRCEHVWAEVINLRGKSFQRTIQGLKAAGAGLTDEAERLAAVSGPGNEARWETYARETFLAHTHHCPQGKLRFLQYVSENATDWWVEQRSNGAVLIGQVAEEENLIVYAPSASPPGTVVEVLALPDEEAIAYRAEREEVVNQALRRSILAAKALHEIHIYKGGLLWNREFPSFEAYCKARWGYQKAHAYRLSTCGEFVAELENQQSPIGDCWLPANESQVRSVLALPREHRVECWKEVVAALPADRRTAEAISRETKRLVAAKGIQRTKPAAKTPPISPKITAALRNLRRAASGHAHATEIEEALKGIEQWLRS